MGNAHPGPSALILHRTEDNRTRIEVRLDVRMQGVWEAQRRVEHPPHEGMEAGDLDRAVLSWAGVVEEERVNEFAGQPTAPLFCWAG